MAVNFQKARRKRKPARIIIGGPPGSGKSNTMLLLLRGLVGPEGKFGVVDTEDGAIELYAEQPDMGYGDFDVVTLREPTADNIVAALEAAKQLGLNGVGIDGLTPEWAEILAGVDRHNDKHGSGWREQRPKHTSFVRAFLAYPGHIVCTGRVKTMTERSEDADGKTVIRTLGLGIVSSGAQAGTTVDYEFDIILDMDDTHTATVRKARAMNWLHHAVIQRPGVELGASIAAWLAAGSTPWEPPVLARRFQVGERTIESAGVLEGTYIELLNTARIVGKEKAAALFKATGKASLAALTEPEAQALLAAYREVPAEPAKEVAS